jgi:hypothetical protein
MMMCQLGMGGPLMTFGCLLFMRSNSVLLGNRRQGSKVNRSAEHLRGRETNGIAGLPPEVVGPRGRYLTGLVEPCGALPRKCYYYYFGCLLGCSAVGL